MSWLKTAYVKMRKRRAARTFSHHSVVKGRDVSFGPFAARAGTPGDGVSVSIGDHVYLDCTVVTVDEGVVEIGSNCWIGGAGTTAIGAVNRVTIGSDVIVSNHVHIYDNNNHPTDPDARRRMTRGEFFGPLWSWQSAASAPVIICDNVWIGEHSYIGKGVTIGVGAIIAAHSVVTKDVPPFTVFAGNPGRVVKSLLT